MPGGGAGEGVRQQAWLGLLLLLLLLPGLLCVLVEWWRMQGYPLRWWRPWWLLQGLGNEVRWEKHCVIIVLILNQLQEGSAKIAWLYDHLRPAVLPLVHLSACGFGLLVNLSDYMHLT